MKTVKEFAVPTLILCAICLVATLLLALTNDVTAPIIEELAVQTEQDARKMVLPSAESFEQGEALTLNDIQYDCYKGVTGGSTAGYVFTTTAKGYGGDLKVMTGIDNEGKVTGVEILEISETAGLGMNASKEEFRNQYIGKSGEVYVSKDKSGDNSIDALTGATITSRAVTRAVNDALELYALASGGER